MEMTNEGKFVLYQVQFKSTEDHTWSGGYSIGGTYNKLIGTDGHEKYAHVMKDYNLQWHVSGHHGYSTIETAKDAYDLVMKHGGHPEWDYRISKVTLSKKTETIVLSNKGDQGDHIDVVNMSYLMGGTGDDFVFALWDPKARRFIFDVHCNEIWTLETLQSTRFPHFPKRLDDGIQRSPNVETESHFKQRMIEAAQTVKAVWDGDIERQRELQLNVSEIKWEEDFE